MRKNKPITYFLASIIFTFILFLLTSFHITKAQTIRNIDDGISNWVLQTNPNSQIGQLPIGDQLNLGYAFGLAQDTSGKVKAGDSTITKDSTAPSINNIYYSKMNVFLNNNGNYYSSTFQSGFSSVATAAQEVSMTSPNFLLAPTNSQKTISARDFAILGVNTNNNGNIGMTNKQYYVGTDSNGNPAYKIVGDFTRKNEGAKNGEYTLTAELLLRASPTNAAIVHRELYLYNPTDNTQEFTILFGEDTKLGSSDGSADRVPIYDLGNKNGIFIQNESKEYRLMVTNLLPDGFQYYAGQEFSVGGTGNNWVKALNPATVSGTGNEADNNPYGTDLLKRSADTSYILRWNPTTLAPGETSHYASTMGVTAKPYSVPMPSKTYQNLNSTDGKNRIGDKLKFSLKIINEGYYANWSYEKLTDQLPKGLQIDPNTIQLSNNDETSQTLDPSNYDANSRTLTVLPSLSLTDNQFATVTFEASITNEALDNLDDNGNLTNTSQFFGTDQNVVNSTQKTYKAEVDIPIQKPAFNFSFKKQVKNISAGETDFQDSTTAKNGDIVNYKINYQVDESSQDYLVSGAQLTDDLPNGIERTDDLVSVTGPDGNTYYSNEINTGIIDVKQGQSVSIDFTAKVVATSAGIITNVAKVSGGLTSGGQSPGDMISNGANIAVEDIDTFTSIPNLINFGSAHMYGTTQTLTNVSTDGELIVSHPTASDFKVHVAYDNDDSDQQMSNDNGDTLQPNTEGLIFIRQRNSDHTDEGTWTPISKTGTPIQTDTFSGNQSVLNLTNYIGVGDWKINLDSTTKTGNYTGTLTWSMVDSMH